MQFRTLVEKKKINHNYIVPHDGNIDEQSATIRITFVDGEYVYVPRKYTFANSTTLSIQELQMIIDKLKELNNNKKSF